MDYIIDSKLFQLKNDGTEIRALNLGVGVLLQVLVEGFFCEKSVAFTGSRSTGSTGSLLRASSADWTYEQRLNSEPRIIYFLLGETWINHVDNSVNGERGLSDVGCHYYFSASDALVIRWRRIVEDSLLLLRWKSTVKG